LESGKEVEKMKGKILSLAIFLVMILSSFGVVGLNITNSSERTNFSDEKIEELQKIIDEKGWHFSVDKSSATERTIDQLCGVKIPENWEGTAIFDPCTPTTMLPESLDWRDPNNNYVGRNCVTSIRNQGHCGSCWAFGTVAPLESAVIIEEGIVEDLSEQWLVSCNTDGYGCNGGWWAHKWHAGVTGQCGGTGAVREEKFPYTSGQTGDEPLCNGPYPHVFLITDWAYIGDRYSVPKVSAIKQAIYDYGPVSALVYVDESFQYYSRGVFDSSNDGTINHAVTLVGWDDSYEYQGNTYGVWILRNSWDDDWGDDGYMYITYNTHRIGYASCYIGEYERLSSGEETVNVYVKTITNKGDEYEPIDPIGSREPEWYYKVHIGTDFSITNENLKEGTSGAWPWHWESEHTWNVDQGHLAYVKNPTVDVKIEVWDYDLANPDDKADITPKSGRAFVGEYDLIDDKLVYSDGTSVPTEGDYYSIKGTQNDNAKIKFEVTDSYDYEEFKPKISVNPSTLNFGEKSQGSYSDTFTIKNTAKNDPNDWAPNLDWTASDDRDWISVSPTSGSLAGGEHDTVTVSIDANDLERGKTHSGTIDIESNDVSKTVTVSIKISKGKSLSLDQPPLIIFKFMQFLKNKFL
jgi:hypothetical protein